MDMGGRGWADVGVGYRDGGPARAGSLDNFPWETKVDAQSFHGSSTAAMALVDVHGGAPAERRPSATAFRIMTSRPSPMICAWGP